MKNSLKRAFSAVALTAVAASVSSMSAFATGYDSVGNADAAVTTPTVTLDKIVLTADEAPGKVVDMNLSVSGAQLAYASTGFHIYWDSRLDINVDETFGEVMITSGPAAQRLSKNNPKADPGAAQQGMSGYFVATAGEKDLGIDGVIWTFQFTLPSDAAAGDVYPFDIIYKSTPNAKDLFMNKAEDENGNNMQAYVFTKGIYSSDNPTFAADAADIAKVPALADINNTYDGYIAVEAGTTITTTTTTTTSTTTTTTTTRPTTTTTTSATTTSTTTSATTSTTTSATTTSTTTSSGVITTTTTSDVTTSSTSSTKAGTTTTTKAGTTTTTKAGTTTTTKKGGTTESPKTGVAGVGVAAAGLAIALGTAFVLRKKED